MGGTRIPLTTRRSERDKKMATTKEIEIALLEICSNEEFADVLDELVEECDEQIDVESIKTFDSEMVLTGNDGIVLKLTDGSEFQITIVKSN